MVERHCVGSAIDQLLSCCSRESGVNVITASPVVVVSSMVLVLLVPTAMLRQVSDFIVLITFDGAEYEHHACPLRQFENQLI